MAYSHKFPLLGLTCFWFLNDVCDDKLIDRQIEGFSKTERKII